MIDSANIKQTSTATTSPIESQTLNVNPKIIGYLTQIECCQQKFTPLKKILPVSTKLLNFLLVNLISTVLEVIKRDLPTPDIRLDKIMVIKDDYENGIPYIASKQDGTTAKNFEEILLKNFQSLCKSLGFEQNLIYCTSLYDFQQSLFGKISMQQCAFEENSEVLLEYLQIEKEATIYYQKDFTQVFLIKPPKWLVKSQNGDFIAIKVSQQNEEIYELREITIIEEFNHKHLPYLHGYLRYSDILILFLKKHDMTLSGIIKSLYLGRNKNKSVSIEQILLKLYRQMVTAIIYLHSIDIIHRDLKPENIMFDFQSPVKLMIEILDTQVTCVLIDYDRSKMVENLSSQKQSHHVGTRFYRPPEGEQIKYFPSYDIWQLGFIWFVTPKIFLQSEDFQDLTPRQNAIQQNNSQISKYKEEIKIIEQKLKDSTEKSINQLQNKINQLQNNINESTKIKEQVYQELVEAIEKKDSWFTYSKELQAIIKGMIQFEPQNRTTLDQVLIQLDQIMK